MAEKINFKIIPLVCPECGKELDGLSNDTIYLCSNCRKGWEFTKDTLLPIKVFKAIPVVTPISSPISSFPSSLFYLPFLVFEVKNIQVKADTPERRSELKLMPKIDYVFIKAYNSSRDSMYGNVEISFMLKLRKEDIALEPADALYGCARVSSTFAPFLKYFLLGAIDRKIDVSGAEVRFDTGEHFVAAVPFYREGALIKDALTGNEMLIMCVDDFNEIYSAYVSEQ